MFPRRELETTLHARPLLPAAVPTAGITNRSWHSLSWPHPEGPSEPPSSRGGPRDDPCLLFLSQGQRALSLVVSLPSFIASYLPVGSTLSGRFRGQVRSDFSEGREASRKMP